MRKINWLQNRTSKKRPYKKRKQTRRRLSKRGKQLLFSLFASFFIGTMLGTFTLHMSKQDEKSYTTMLNTTVAEVQDDTTLKNIDSIQVYVVQGGMFDKKENATELSKSLENKSVPILNWQRDETYYLFLGIANTLEEADKLAAKRKQDGLDVYVKEWEVGGATHTISETDHNWLLLFIEQWKKSLDTSVKGNGIRIKEWTDLTKKGSRLSEKMAAFSDRIRSDVQQMEKQKMTEREEQQFLMQLLYDYETAIK